MTRKVRQFAPVAAITAMLAGGCAAPGLMMASGERPVVASSPAAPPAVVGTHLNLDLTETATEKAMELSRRLAAAESEKAHLAARVADLESGEKVKDQALRQAGAEIQAARMDLKQALAEMERWKTEIAALKEQLRGANQENIETLQAAVSLLQQVLKHGDDGDEAGPQMPNFAPGGRQRGDE